MTEGNEAGSGARAPVEGRLGPDGPIISTEMTTGMRAEVTEVKYSTKQEKQEPS